MHHESGIQRANDVTRGGLEAFLDGNDIMAAILKV